MGMNVNLTPQLEELVPSRVASGLCTSASDGVREALRLMDEKDRMREARLEQLRDDVFDGETATNFRDSPCELAQVSPWRSELGHASRRRTSAVVPTPGPSR